MWALDGPIGVVASWLRPQRLFNTGSWTVCGLDVPTGMRIVLCHSGRVKALELAEQVPMVRKSTTGAEAARVIAEYRLSGLVVADADGVPIAVVPGSQLLGLVLPQYVRDDPNLAHAYDEEGADELCGVLNKATIGELLEAKRLAARKPPSVLPEDTLIEMASVMDRVTCPWCWSSIGTAATTAHHDEPGPGRDRDRGRAGQPWCAAAGTRRAAPHDDRDSRVGSPTCSSQVCREVWSAILPRLPEGTSCADRRLLALVIFARATS